MQTSFRFVTLLALLGACPAGQGDAAKCPVGLEGCACSSEGACDAGLVCGAVSRICGPGGASTGAASGSSEGDGETTGPSRTSEAGTTGDAGQTGVATTASTDGTASSASSGLTGSSTGDTTGGGAPHCGQVDVLFVLDPSASLADERAALADEAAFRAILDRLVGLGGQGVDYRVGVTDDHDSGFYVPGMWSGAKPWFDSGDMTRDQIATAFASSVARITEDSALGCEHVLTSATRLLEDDTSGFVREGALLALVFLTDVDDYGAYDQVTGNTCAIGCDTAGPAVSDLRSRLDAVKGGAGALAAIVVGGDPNVSAGVDLCGRPGSCCTGVDCAVFHADRLYAFATLLGARATTYDPCGGDVAGGIEAAMDTVEAACVALGPSR